MRAPESRFNTGMTQNGKPIRHKVDNPPVWKPSKSFQVPGDIIFYAFRYALGRSSYAVTEVTSEIRAHAPMLTVKTRNTIVKEIKEAFSDWDMTVDSIPYPHREEWERTLKVLDSGKLEEMTE